MADSYPSKEAAVDTDLETKPEAQQTYVPSHTGLESSDHGITSRRLLWRAS